MSEGEPLASYVCQFVRGTDAAVLVAEIANPKVQHWLPRSRVRIEEGAFGQLRITMPMSLARQKGLLAPPDARQGRLL